eukprot:gene25625-biopygen9045
MQSACLETSFKYSEIPAIRRTFFDVWAEQIHALLLRCGHAKSFPNVSPAGKMRLNCEDTRCPCAMSVVLAARVRSGVSSNIPVVQHPENGRNGSGRAPDAHRTRAGRAPYACRMRGGRAPDAHRTRAGRARSRFSQGGSLNSGVPGSAQLLVAICVYSSRYSTFRSPHIVWFRNSQDQVLKRFVLPPGGGFSSIECMEVRMAHDPKQDAQQRERSAFAAGGQRVTEGLVFFVGGGEQHATRFALKPGTSEREPGTSSGLLNIPPALQKLTVLKKYGAVLAVQPVLHIFTVLDGPQ